MGCWMWLWGSIKKGEGFDPFETLFFSSDGSDAISSHPLGNAAIYGTVKLDILPVEGTNTRPDGPGFEVMVMSSAGSFTSRSAVKRDLKTFWSRSVQNWVRLGLKLIVIDCCSV